MAISLFSTLAGSSDSSSDSVSSSELVSVSSSSLACAGGGAGLLKKRLWNGLCAGGVSFTVLTAVCLLRGGSVVSALLLDKNFCLTSSVVNGAPVFLTAFEEAVEDSEVLESELAERADFLWPASEVLRVAWAAAVLVAAVLR